ncbi:MAG: 16S rRNA (guanine(966)-N(2))-methyltransferase RsmD [Bacteroidia bacterium]|jgi:16S rRNA (guanine(966)-N(2))-methyltransferase RsmD|nr:16S rRNA (guanine(966)-N(2))-methyltransferase RsmD [Bacteroidia bacterium]
MRIIGGTHKGRVIKTPRDLPVRPTTDFAKEALFNILQNRFNLSDCRILDLFSGTGHISLEFASRGAQNIVSVDLNNKCVSFISATAEAFGFKVSVIKTDVFKFLEKEKEPFDLIFADPPYDLKNIDAIHTLVYQHALLKPGGWLIIEHGERTSLKHLAHFINQRRYGGVNFSIFESQLAAHE